MRAVTRRMKGRLRSLLAPVLLAGGYGDQVLRRARDRAVILMYHRVVDGDGSDGGARTARDRFEAQMRYVRDRMTPVPLSQLVDSLATGRPLPANAAVVTFDDGYEDNHQHAFPILRALGVPATVFITTGHVGTRRAFWWDQVAGILARTAAPALDLGPLGVAVASVAGARRVLPLGTEADRAAAAAEVIGLLKGPGRRRVPEAVAVLADSLGVAPDAVRGPAMLSWDQVREMHAGGVEFGAHTVTHRDLATLRPAEVRYEIDASRRAIEGRLGAPVTTLAYPYGQAANFTDDVEAIAKQLGFRGVCLATAGVVSRRTSVFRLPRVSMSAMPVAEAAWKIWKHLDQDLDGPTVAPVVAR